MSRRDKQADLRRRMAEARAKLVTSSHANASDLDNEIATNTFKKRPLPSAGGILKKSKYSSAPAVPPSQTDTPKIDDKSIDNNALGSLMADYGDSSDEDTNTNTKAASTSNIYDQSKQSSEPIQPTTTNNDIQQQLPKKKKKKKKKRKDKPQLEDTNELNGNNKTAATQLKSEEEGNDKPTEVSDEVWDEFNALLDDDNDDEVVAKESISLKSEDTNNSIPVQEGETSINTETTTKKKKKKKAKKKKDMYDNDDMNTVEQASYEARLARLMLLKSKKTQHKMSIKTDEDDDDEKLLSASTNEFYNGGLAFQQDEEEDEYGDAESKANSTANLKTDGAEEADAADDTNTTTVSNTVASSISAPSVSLASILRGRRDQARQLSRGDDKIDTANDDEEEDESWF